MNKFAIAFRKARLNSDKTFRQIKDQVGLSIGYLSGIENGQRNPPEIQVVKKLEEFFSVTDGHLVELAKRERVTIPTTIGQLIKARPKLQEVLFRADALSDEGLDTFLEELRKHFGEDNGEPFYLNFETVKYFDREMYQHL